jgi:hypothetical protein
MALFYPQLKHRHTWLKCPSMRTIRRAFDLTGPAPYFYVKSSNTVQIIEDPRDSLDQRRAANLFEIQRNKSSNLSLFESAYRKSTILKSESKSQSQIRNQKRNFRFLFIVLLICLLRSTTSESRPRLLCSLSLSLSLKATARPRGTPPHNPPGLPAPTKPPSTTTHPRPQERKETHPRSSRHFPYPCNLLHHPPQQYQFSSALFLR